MASEWRQIPIIECIDLIGGGTPKTSVAEYWDGDIPWLSVKDFNNDYRHVYATEKHITEAGLNNSSTKLLQKEDIIISARGTVGEMAIIPFPMAFNQSCYGIRAKTGVNSTFLYYLLKNSISKLKLMTHGSVFDTITRDTFATLIVGIPDRETQDVIANTLAAIDDKIELNNKINDNLYVQARAITNHWIAENEGDYELLPLNEIAAINPDTYSPKQEWEYVNYLDTSSITDGYIADVQRITPSNEKLPSRARRIISANDVVFSTVRPNQRHFGIISEPLPNMLASTGFAVIRSKHPLVCNELIYLCLTENVFIEKMQQLAEQSTSTFPSIKPSDLGVCEIPCPKDDSSSNLAETLKAMFVLIAANNRENTYLAELRDTLLPKLMSGEIDVSNIEI